MPRKLLPVMLVAMCFYHNTSRPKYYYHWSIISLYYWRWIRWAIMSYIIASYDSGLPGHSKRAPVINTRDPWKDSLTPPHAFKLVRYIILMTSTNCSGASLAILREDFLYWIAGEEWSRVLIVRNIYHFDHSLSSIQHSIIIRESRSWFSDYFCYYIYCTSAKLSIDP